MPAWLGPAIAAGASLLGGLFGQKKQDKQFDKNVALQREFAQSGIQWKVEDAKKAGIHPLYAIGANTHSFNPVHVGGSSLASGMAQAGQDISRAIDATRSSSQRDKAYVKTVRDLTVQKMGLENALLASQIAKMRSPGNPPALPTTDDPMLIEGQAQTVVPSIPRGSAMMAQGSGTSPRSSIGRHNYRSGVREVPMQRNATHPGRPYQEAGAVPGLGYARTNYGYMPVMSEDIKKRLEDDHLGMTFWNFTNRILPTFGIGQKPPDVPLPKGYAWRYNPVLQQYTPHKKGWFGIYY